jgi:single-strand DNA-binding protein
MASFNRVILMGNLTRDVEVRYLQNGTAVTDISLAINDRRKNNAGEWVDEVSYFDVTLWARNAEVAGEYLTKGSPVLIEGRLKQETWEQEGQKRSKVKVIADQMRMVGGKGGGGGGPGGRSNQPETGHADEYSEPAHAQAGPRPGRATSEDNIPF